jgi:ABC-type cobalamin/Fe3+-siderophores transport system ATPase subunit
MTSGSADRTGLKIHDVAYAAGAKQLLHALRLDVQPGRLIAIVGPNGAGKTTLLRIVAGVLRGQGAMFIDETRVETMSRRARARSIAYVPAEDAPVEDLTVWEIVAEGRYAHREGLFDRAAAHDDVVHEALEQTGLRAFKYRPFHQLSSGERRRAWIALGLAQQAPILLFDEPTAHLDFRFAQQTLRLMRQIASEHRTVITVLHDLNEAAQVADDIALLDNGHLICVGTPRDVLTPERISRCYGVDVEVVTTSDATIRIFARA